MTTQPNRRDARWEQVGRLHLTSAGLDRQAELTGAASTELTGAGLDHQAELTGAASTDLTGAGLDQRVRDAVPLSPPAAVLGVVVNA